MKCAQCRKLDDGTIWERIRNAIFHCFTDDIADLSQNKFTQGFADGYKMGMQKAQEYEKQKVNDLNKIYEI